MTTLEELIKEMPPEIQQKAADVLEFLLQERYRQTQSFTKPVTESSFKRGGKSKFTERRRCIAHARAELVRLYRQEAALVPKGKKMAAKKKFIQDYNRGYYPQIYDILQKTSLPTIERWNRTLRKTGDPLDLTPRWGEHRRGKTGISLAQKLILLTLAKRENGLSMRERARTALKMMDAQGVQHKLCLRTYERFLK
jgi:hypothetical protein